MQDSVALQTLDEIKNQINRYHNYVVSTHLNPDGDAIGTQMALYYMLKKLNKTVYLLNHDSTPRNLAFLDPDKAIIHFDPEKDRHLLDQCECIFIVDTNSWERIGSVGEDAKNRNIVSICIDHHIPDKLFSTYMLNSLNACAASEILYYLIKYMNVALDENISRSIYAGILTDTGSFRFPRTNQKTHRIIAELLENNVNPAVVYQEIYETNSNAALHLLGIVLNTLETDINGQLAWLTVTGEMITTTGASKEDMEGLVNYTLILAGVKIGLLFREESATCTKVSFRSKGSINIGQIAKNLGGGGHMNAAGVRLNVPLLKAAEMILDQCRELLKTS